jgi:hypothetical protein
MYRGGGEEEKQRKKRKGGRGEGEREREREREREASIPHFLRKMNYALSPFADRGERERD